MEPRTGPGLWGWAKDQEARYSFGICRYLVRYGRLNDFPGNIKDWDREQVKVGYEEAKRRLGRHIASFEVDDYTD